MLLVLASILGIIVVVATGLSLIRHKAWWVRVWDFPRFQLAMTGLLALALWVAADPWLVPWQLAGGALVLMAVVYQGALIWRYTRLAPVEVKRAADPEPATGLSLVVANVLQTNRAADRLLAAIREADPDVVLCVETDAWWCERLESLRPTHPHIVAYPLDNTYGMLLASRLPLERESVECLVQDGTPSIQARVQLRGGQQVWLNCLHPRPPIPGESEDSGVRDAELLQVAARVRGATMPVVVCGDLNDVAWSRTTRLFQKISGLLDPRKGRGFFATFPAHVPGFRCPLDHIFHSSDFRLRELRRMGKVGSDHFPVHAVLSYEPEARSEQRGPTADQGDVEETEDTIADEKTGHGR